MIVEFYLIGCLFAFCFGWMKANEESLAGYDIKRLGVVMIIITILSWIYIAYWFWDNFGSGPRAC